MRRRLFDPTKITVLVRYAIIPNALRYKNPLRLPTREDLIYLL